MLLGVTKGAAPFPFPFPFPIVAVSLKFAAICGSHIQCCTVTSKLNYGHADASFNATNKLSINAAQKYTNTPIHWEKEGQCLSVTPIKVWQGAACGMQRNHFGRCAQMGKQFAPVHNKMR